jgi:Protein of unknown function (DUF3303)
MLYMVVERFTHGPGPVYQRAAEQGRLLPPGLDYVDSWVDERLDRCFQLMRTHDSTLLEEWTKRWEDLVEFEIVAVVASTQAAEQIADIIPDP